MPNIQAAKKALRQSLKRYAKNSVVKRKIHDSFKDFMDMVKTGKKADALKMVPDLTALLDKAANRNVIHHNKAARKKSQLAYALAKK